MCGICGVVRFGSSKVTETLQFDSVAKMTDSMISRGPDSQGLCLKQNMAFGHRRLSIFDLTEKGHQPMVDMGMGLTIVYNGALYNYRELRTDLEGVGYSFYSDSDTEVLLKAYHAWGTKAFDRLNGMFAFAIFHHDNEDVLLVRDRLGIKPLYYSLNNERLIFGSTVQALLASGEVDVDINPIALHYYMSFHSVVPSPETILNGVKKVPPGSFMVVGADGTVVKHQYWNLSFDNTPYGDLDEESWKFKVKEHLERAVKRRLVADVPVGALLSGGLDSSLIVGMLSRLGQNDLNTFSIGFESVGGEKGDEFEYSDIIANYFGTKHHQIVIDNRTLLPALEQCVKAMSEPMVSHDCIGFYLLSQEVSKYVKVVQSGQGADEVFGGYHWYPPLLEAENALDDYSTLFFDGDDQAFRQAVHSRFHKKNYSRDFVAKHFEQPGARSAIDKALRIDTTVMLIDDPVKRVDNMTMAWGLEARVPFLDHELVELAAQVPPEYKIKNDGKHILKEIARKILPSEVIDRPKGYFPVPSLKYFRGEYYDFARDIVTSTRAKNRDLFNDDYVNDVLKDPDNHITPLNGSRLWQMTLLHYWLDINEGYANENRQKENSSKNYNGLIEGFKESLM